jgi:hypothetical protein
MAYDKADLEKKALAAIKRHKLVFVEEVVSYLPCSKPTFYEHKLNESDAVKESIEKNKINRKVGLRDKMYKAENPTAWIALYKLLGSDDEADRLNGSKQKHELTGKDGAPIETLHRVIKPKKNDDAETA